MPVLVRDGGKGDWLLTMPVLIRDNAGLTVPVLVRGGVGIKLRYARRR